MPVQLGRIALPRLSFPTVSQPTSVQDLCDDLDRFADRRARTVEEFVSVSESDPSFPDGGELEPTRERFEHWNLAHASTQAIAAWRNDQVVRIGPPNVLPGDRARVFSFSA